MDDKTEPQKTSKLKISNKLVSALAIFTLAGAATVAILPGLAATLGVNGQPTFLQIVLTGLVLILLTAVLLAWAAKSLGFGIAWFLLALAYNLLIVVMKFIIPPASLYTQTFYLGIGAFDPNASQGYGIIAALVMLLYLAVLLIIYSRHKKRLAQKLGVIPAPAAKKRFNKIWFVVLAIVVLLVLITGGSLLLVFLLPLFFAAPAISYFQYLLSLWWVPLILIVCIGLAIFTGNKAFSLAEKRSLEVRDGTILASFFWLAFSMILIYHGLWVIYMGVMLSIWPFRTIAPSGK